MMYEKMLYLIEFISLSLTKQRERKDTYLLISEIRDITSDSVGIKGIIKDTMNNSMPTNLIT